MRMRKIFTLLMLLLLFGAGTYAQQTITGKVTSAATGETLPAATVKILGTTNGTLTDIDGNYTIKVSSGNDVLEISYVGYATQTVKVGDSVSKVNYIFWGNFDPTNMLIIKSNNFRGDRMDTSA